MARLTERILADFAEIRRELESEVRRFSPQEFVWEPRPGMKSCKQQVQEIGVTEIECAQWLRGGPVEEWDRIWEGLEPQLIDPERSLEVLGDIRRQTVDLIQTLPEETLPIARFTPPQWEAWRRQLEPEELLRWLARHEYYHLGQIVAYRWLLGDNPYKRDQ